MLVLCIVTIKILQNNVLVSLNFISASETALSVQCKHWHYNRRTGWHADGIWKNVPEFECLISW